MLNKYLILQTIFQCFKNNTKLNQAFTIFLIRNKIEGTDNWGNPFFVPLEKYEIWGGAKNLAFRSGYNQCTFTFSKSTKQLSNVQEKQHFRNMIPILVHIQAFRIITLEPLSPNARASHILYIGTRWIALWESSTVHISRLEDVSR